MIHGFWLRAGSLEGFRAYRALGFRVWGLGLDTQDNPKK